MHIAPPDELKSLSSPWPFSWWGMDLLGPFIIVSNQNKYLIMDVDYFTKGIEAEPLAKITARDVLHFYKRNILSRFGVPLAIITDNGTQFTNKVRNKTSLCFRRTPLDERAGGGREQSDPEGP